MKKKAVMAMVGAIAGFLVGYLIFGKILGSYVSLSALFDFSGGTFGDVGRSIGGIKDIQQKVLVTTLVGAVGGFIYGTIKKK